MIREIVIFFLILIHILNCFCLVVGVLFQRGEEGLFRKFSTVQKIMSTGSLYKMTIVNMIIFLLLPMLFYALIITDYKSIKFI